MSLWEKTVLTTKNALSKKALHPILTKCEIVEHNGIPFILRIVDNLVKKDKEKKKQKEKQKDSSTFVNPFLPYDKDLFIDNIGNDHVLILNKFNVFEHHLLIITRDFEHQESALNSKDFSALWTILSQIKGLGFYNSGELSGASQPHKHLQLVPYPLADNVDNIPLHNLILSNKKYHEILTLNDLPYLHSIVFFDNLKEHSREENGKILEEYYQRLLKKVNITIENDKPNRNYNLLITEDWMMIIPRSQEKFASISINSLGFAGVFLVKNEEQLKLIKDSDLLTILSQVGIDKNE